MNTKQKFQQFLESLKTNDNIALIESIISGYSACFEAVVKYVGIDPFMNQMKEYQKITEEIPLKTFNKEEALSQVIESWSKREPTDDQLEFILSKKPQVIIDGNKFFLTGHKGWNTIRKFAGNIYADRINAMSDIKRKSAEISLRNIMRSKKLKGDMTSQDIKSNDMIKKNRMDRLSSGFDKFAKEELTA